jgi:hypothetical protein
MLLYFNDLSYLLFITKEIQENNIRQFLFFHSYTVTQIQILKS